MPLLNSTSRHAFSQNVATEMAAGKPQKQAVAIAYSQKRKAANGGRNNPFNAAMGAPLTGRGNR